MAVTNARALHNPRSPQYDRDCIKCHADVLEERSLDPSVRGAHPVMLPWVGGETNGACATCHRSVDFDNGSAANIRRNVDVEFCAACHSANGPGSPYYVR
jgi:hypothetical protein